MHVQSGLIALPRFQRFETWSRSLIERFLTSVIKGLPVGPFLILEVAGESPFIYRPVSGAPPAKNVRELLLDGQQRLTALWRTLNDNYPDRTFLVEIPEEEVISQARWRWERRGLEYPLWVDIPSECWGRKRIPLKMLNPLDERGYIEWVRQATDDPNNRLG